MTLRFLARLAPNQVSPLHRVVNARKQKGAMIMATTTRKKRAGTARPSKGPRKAATKRRTAKKK
jgi:regulator of extracellular matrix RemA (YlzA/DUF370 family)